MFSEETKNHLIEFGKEKEMRAMEQYLIEYKRRYIQRLEPRPSRPKRLLGKNGLIYIQKALSRSQSLIEGSVVSTNNSNALLGILATRAHFETTAAMGFFLKKLLSFYRGSITYEQLDEALCRLTLGAKIPELRQAPEPISVMSMIDAADNLFRQLSRNKTSVFKESYDFLSEFCHPNYLGLGITMTSKTGKAGIIGFSYSSVLSKKGLIFLSYLVISIKAFLLFYDKTFKLLDEHEELPIICRDARS